MATALTLAPQKKDARPEGKRQSVLMPPGLSCTFPARPMGALWRAIEWIGLVLAVGIAGLTVLFLLARRRILRRVAEDLAGESPLMAAGAQVGEYGRGNGKSPGAAGILMLFRTGLYFRSWVGNREVFVSGPAISWIGVADRPEIHRHGQGRVGRSAAHGLSPSARPEGRAGTRSASQLIVVRFLNAAGKADAVAIRLMNPEQWVEAIKTHLIARLT
jgi:hypothetical protein